MLLDSQENKEKILTEFLQIAAFDGWNKESLLKALDHCKINRDFCNLIFENDILDLTEFYINLYNQKSLEKLDSLEGKKIRDKIRLCLYARFEVEKDNHLALQRLKNFYLNPKNFLSTQVGVRPLAYAIRDCYQIADFMWKTIGDTSTDFNFYTKRLTLGKIIFRSFFIFLKDEDVNLKKTKSFIDLEIEKVMKFEKFKVQFKDFSNKGKKTLCQFILDEKGLVKSPKDIVKNLPFIRLIKF